MTEAVRKRLGIEGQCVRSEAFSGFANQVTKMDVQKIDVKLSAIDSDNILTFNNVTVVDNICAPVRPPNDFLAVALNQQLLSNIEWLKPQPVHILLGIDHLEPILRRVERFNITDEAGEIRRGILWLTALGNAPSGLSPSSSSVTFPLHSKLLHVLTAIPVIDGDGNNLNDVHKSVNMPDNVADILADYLGGKVEATHHLTKLLERHLFNDAPVPKLTHILTPAEKSISRRLLCMMKKRSVISHPYHSWMKGDQLTTIALQRLSWTRSSDDYATTKVSLSSAMSP